MTEERSTADLLTGLIELAGTTVDPDRRPAIVAFLRETRGIAAALDKLPPPSGPDGPPDPTLPFDPRWPEIAE